MAKKKPPPPPPKESIEKQGDREILYKEGEFKYLHWAGWKGAKFRAMFADDPNGCYGFGETKAGARAMLYDYEEP